MTEDEINKMMGSWPVGATVKETRGMTAEEAERAGWEHPSDWMDVMVIEFDDGGILYPSRDGEGNGGGVLFGECQLLPGSSLSFYPVRGDANV